MWLETICLVNGALLNFMRPVLWSRISSILVNILCSGEWTVCSSFVVGSFLSFFLLKRFYLFTFRERAREGGREGENQWRGRETSISCLSHRPQPRIALRDHTQPAEPQRLGLELSSNGRRFKLIDSAIQVFYLLTFCLFCL